MTAILVVACVLLLLGLLVVGAVLVRVTTRNRAGRGLHGPGGDGARPGGTLSTLERLQGVESSLERVERDMAFTVARTVPTGSANLAETERSVPATPTGATSTGAGSSPAGSGLGTATVSDGRPPGDAERAARVLAAVWQLQCLDLELERRREAGLSTAVSDDVGPVGLADAVVEEIGRTREEIGTPGGFSSDLDTEPDPSVALLLLQSVHAMLAFVARRSQAFDLHLYRSERGLNATVVCDDFEGDLTDPQTTAIAGAIGPAGGELTFDRQPDGRVRAHLSVPGT